ncbi:hypothetical protein [Streptomyces mirabilis]|jgi:hypothetical protein|uniref:hypothetical protein n=1 Tax=Streptomyces mirabilis TaxID=68239 RepID=UPI0034067773
MPVFGRHAGAPIAGHIADLGIQSSPWVWTRLPLAPFVPRKTIAQHWAGACAAGPP